MLALRHIGSGKVRELYEVDDDRLLMVATDRISAYDRVLPDPIPDKGKVLTGLSIFWFGMLETPHHFLTVDLPDGVSRQLAGRAMVVRRAEVIPMECVVRGYLFGSAWLEYRAGGGPATEHLPSGLELAAPLEEPIFTPATKAASGHDQNLTEAEACGLVGSDLYQELRRRSIEIYLRGSRHAVERGILLADTKLEFGFSGDELLLVDEVLTPDSSRYWPADSWHPGRAPASFDKQPVRDWLDRSGWDRESPPPRLPTQVIEDTRARYVQAYQRLTGRRFEDYLGRIGA